jgi:DNA-binding IclR family transcriptional regulator
MTCTIDIVRIATRLAEAGDAVTVERIAAAWGRSYGSTHRMVKHAESMGWLERGTLLPTPTGLEVTGRA